MPSKLAGEERLLTKQNDPSSELEEPMLASLDSLNKSSESVDEKLPPVEIVWFNVAWYFFLHALGIYGLYLLPKAHVYTLLFGAFLTWASSMSITAGAHRLWTHRSYHAKLPLRIFLALANLCAMQNSIIEWSRDHRVHHKFTETNADPYNAMRGFFFSHIGWLMSRKHPAVKEKGSKLNLDDLRNDPVCRIQDKYYKEAALFMNFIMPTLVPWYFWGENAWIAYVICGITRYIIVLNLAFSVNSFAHMWGSKPYDKNIHPADNWFVIFVSWGEGFHNFHHAFPSDYSTSEFGFKYNATTMFIDTMAWLGLAEHLKKASPEAVLHKQQRSGDGTLGYGHPEGGLFRTKKLQKYTSDSNNNE